MFPGEEFSGTSESGCYSSKINSTPYRWQSAQLLLNIPDGRKLHASRTLYNRFEDESCQFIGMFLQQMLQRTVSSGFHSSPNREEGGREEVADGKCRTKDTVHPRYRIAYRHGIPGISVVTVTDGDEIIFSGFPAAYQYCTAIFSATSTATEPESA